MRSLVLVLVLGAALAEVVTNDTVAVDKQREVDLHEVIIRNAQKIREQNDEFQALSTQIQRELFEMSIWLAGGPYPDFMAKDGAPRLYVKGLLVHTADELQAYAKEFRRSAKQVLTIAAWGCITTAFVYLVMRYS